MQNERRYYRITALNIGEKTERIKDYIYVIAEEVNGNYVDILTNKKIYVSDSNLIDERKFLNDEYSLFGIEKLETTRRQVANGLLFITRASKENYMYDVLELEHITRTMILKRVNELENSEKMFQEEINKGRVK